MPAAEVIAKYHDLWHVERSFRMSKTDLRGPAHVPPHPRCHRGAPDHRVHRPGRRALPSRTRTGLAIANVIKQLRPLRQRTIAINGATQTFPPEIPEAQREILADLGIKPGY